MIRKIVYNRKIFKQKKLFSDDEEPKYWEKTKRRLVHFETLDNNEYGKRSKTERKQWFYFSFSRQSSKILQVIKGKKNFFCIKWV